MRTFKRFLSLALVLVMAISLMSVAVFAEGETTDATQTAADKEFASLSNSKKIATLGASECVPVPGSTIATYLDPTTNKGVVMWVDQTSDRAAVSNRFLNEHMNVEGKGFPATVKLSDGTVVDYYIPKADFVADGQYHYYKIDDILVGAGNTISSITLFMWGNAQVYTRYIPAFTEDTYVDLYFRIQVDGDVGGNGSFTDDDGNVYQTKYTLNQCVVVKDEIVAEVGGTPYTSLQAAVDAAQDGDTVTVLANISDETVTVNKALTINGDATLNNVTIKDVSLTADEEFAALTDADIFNGCLFTRTSTTVPFYLSGSNSPVYSLGTDPNGKKVAIANAGGDSVTADQLAAFKSETADGVVVGYTADALGMIPAAEIAANANDEQYHVYKVENITFAKDVRQTYFHMFENNGVRAYNVFTPSEDAVVDFYISMRVDGDITCNSEDLPAYYIDKVVIAYSHDNTLKLDGLTFTGDSTVDLGATELTVENCAFNTTTTPIQVNGTASVAVMSTTTVNDNPFTMANISAPSEFTGSLAVGVKADESGKLTGGTFNYDPTAQLAAGCTVKETDGLYEIVKLPAEFNGVPYATLQEAIDAAKAAGGGTVKLINNEKVGTVILPTGVTLDLQEYTLTADYLIGLNGSKLMGATVASDGTGSGKLVIEKDNLLLTGEAPQNASGMSILPVWIEGEGYIFSLFDPINASKNPTLTITDDAISAVFRHNASGYVNKQLFMNNGATPYGLSVKITLTWDVLRDGQPDAKAYQTFDYSDNLIKTIADNAHDYTFNLTSYENMGVNLDSLTVIVTVESDCGVVATGNELDAMVQN